VLTDGWTAGRTTEERAVYICCIIYS